MDIELSCPECGHMVVKPTHQPSKDKTLYVCIECGMTFWYEQESDTLHRFGGN